MLSNKFICASHNYTTFNQFVPSPYFRKSFVVYSMPEKCTVTIGTPGFYELYINGERITKGILAPYISNPDHVVYYDEYDITRYLAEGRNVLGIQLGNGMQNPIGGEIWDFDKAPFRGSPRVAFAIELTNPDGTVDVIEANRTVKTAPSPLIFDDLRCGCFYDARREIPDWSQIKFVDDSWNDALIAEAPRGEKRLCKAEPITSVRHIRATKIRRCTMEEFRYDKRVSQEISDYPTKMKDGWLYDFGITTAGIARLKIKGERGQKIDLQFGEYIGPDGKPDISNIQFLPEGFAQRDIYVLKGEGEEIFEPQFTYHGYRYCVVFGITEEQATPDLLTCIVCSSAIPENGGFRCSDDVLNRLQAMTRNSTLSNFYYFPTDCPQREKNGWTGDASMSARQTILNLAPEKSYKEWLFNIRKAQNEDGMIPGVVPTDKWGYGKGFGPSWDGVIVNLPYFMYLYRGDKEILEENAEAIFRYASFLSRHRTKRGTLNNGLGDWCPVTKVKTPVEFTSSVVAMDNLSKSAFIFDVLKMELQKDFCLKLYDEIRSAVRKYLVDFSSMTAIGRCQTAQSMAIYYNVFDEGEKQQAFKVLEDIIAESDDHIDFGFIGVMTIFRVLCDFGRQDLAYKMIARADYPSFGNWVKKGYTALAENFHPENEFPDSLNHHCFGDISAIFIEYFAGLKVNPYGDDCREVNFQPCFVGALNHAAAFYETVEGKVSVKWERISGGMLLTIEKPEGVYGEIRLPAGYVLRDSGLSYAKLEAGEFLAVDVNAEPENIIEV